MLQMQMPVTAISGVGEKRAALLAKLGVQTVYDLLHHFPRSYVDFSAVAPLGDCRIGDTVTVAARIVEKSPPVRVRSGRTIYRALVSDRDGAVMTITFFNNRFALQNLKPDRVYRFHGKLTGNLLRPEMNTPLILEEDKKEVLQPVYALTAGLSSKALAGCVQRALEALEPVPATCLPSQISVAEGFKNDLSLFWNVHFPKNLDCAQSARLPFLLEELLCLQLGMAGMRRKARRHAGQTLHNTDLRAFWASLPFSPTGAQLRAVSTALSDITSGRSMNRLLQGDVGSGKTLVAAALIYAVSREKGQCALMAPTEILAAQHFKTLSAMLAPFHVRIALLTGSTPIKERRALLKELQNGTIDVLCGTHALLENKVLFKRLSFVVADEQHRFGVAQRAALISKGFCPHVLIMSATPIPRSLALTIYGDLDISILDQLPAGRRSVKTYLITPDIRQRAYAFLEKQIQAERQVYVVCPAVEESPSELEAVLDCFERLQSVFKARRVGLLHGKMKGRDKDAVMTAFRDGFLDILVSTTVIEVGVDVPNANVMMIENADRFGLSQLHQLRGRVGRGAEQSYCILVSDTDAPPAVQRLRLLCKTSDGFEISQFDLKQRGPGDFFGNRQHGLPPLKIATLLSDAKLLEKAQRYADQLLKQDPGLTSPKSAALRKQVNQMFAGLSGGRGN